MERYEYTVLMFKPFGAGNGWFDEDRRLGDAEEIKSILNTYAAQGWRVVTNAASSGWASVIMERPYQPDEGVPALAPEGIGTEPSPAP